MSAESEYICCMCYKPIGAHTHNGEVYWTSGHNAQPLVPHDTSDASMVKHGRCCDSCNDIVLQVRIMSCFGQHVEAKLFTDAITGAKNQAESITAHMRVVMALEVQGRVNV